jgi:hypothetical protein
MGNPAHPLTLPGWLPGMHGIMLQDPEYERTHTYAPPTYFSLSNPLTKRAGVDKYKLLALPKKAAEQKSISCRLNIARGVPGGGAPFQFQFLLCSLPRYSTVLCIGKI